MNLFSGRDPLILLTYFAVNTFIIITNPPRYITEKIVYLGEPIGDLSNEIRIDLSQKLDNGEIETGVSWETNDDICRFSFHWNVEGNVVGSHYDQYNGICENKLSVDYYTLNGINTLSPTGVDLQYKCDNETSDTEYFQYFTQDVPYFEITQFCYYNRKVLRHTFDFYLDDFTVLLGLPEWSSAYEIELLFGITKVTGVYELSDYYFICQEPIGISVDCALKFDFNGELEINVGNSTFSVRSKILQELKDLVGSGILPDDLSTEGMETSLKENIETRNTVENYDINCTASYPYPSSTCSGTYDLILVGSIKNKYIVISSMATIVVVVLILISKVRIGMKGKRNERGYLGPGGACQYFFEGGGERLNFINPVPQILILRIDDNGEFQTDPDSEGTCMGMVTRNENNKIPTHLFTKPVCYICRENTAGTITNLDMEGVHRLLDADSGRALLDESSEGSHLEWARKFSIVDAIGCVFTIWTVHLLAYNSRWGSFYWVAALVAISRWVEESDIRNFIGSFKWGVRVIPKNRNSSAPPLPITLAVMEVLYDLEIPNMGTIGLYFTLLWTIFIIASCGYFVYILGYEPVYDNSGYVSKKVSLKTAISVCTTLNAPFGLAGDWVRRSRRGDLIERSAFSFTI